MPLRFIAKQFRQPTGPLGHLWGWLMNRGNARIIAGSIDALAPEPNHHVLDIGFGGGLGLQRLLTALPHGAVTGTELSDVMLSGAQRRFSEEIARRRLTLVSAAVEQLPLGTATFDGVVTVNTVYFWTDVEQGLKEIRRVLRPGGRLVLAIRPTDSMRRMAFTRHGFTLYESAQLEEMLRLAGFTGVRSQASTDDRLGYICIVAHAPA